MPNEVIYVNSDAFLALIDEDNDRHEEALAFVRQLWGETVKVVTSFLVLAQVSDFLGAEDKFEEVERFWQYFEDRGIRILEMNSAIQEKSKELFFENRGEGGFLNSLKVATMHYYGIHRIFTFNEEFKEFNVVKLP